MLYSNHLDLGLHVDTFTELCRVGGEVIIFPLLQVDAARLRYVELVMEHFWGKGYQVELASVPYELQRGSNEMLTVRSGS